MIYPCMAILFNKLPDKTFISFNPIIVLILSSHIY